jgi:hypothetical protein
MLIQNDFLKASGAEKWLFFEAFGAPIREDLSTIGEVVFLSSWNGHLRRSNRLGLQAEAAWLLSMGLSWTLGLLAAAAPA